MKKFIVNERNIKRFRIFIMAILFGASVLAGCSISDDVRNNPKDPKAPNNNGISANTQPDITAPVIVSVFPASGTSDAALNSTMIVNFSEDMDPASISAATFTVSDGTSNITGAVTYGLASKSASFDPASDLIYNTTYTVTITTGVKDKAGNALVQNYTWTFTTGFAPDTTPPTVTSFSPTNGTTDVPITSVITATFSEAMSASTIIAANFKVNDGISDIAGAVTYDGTSRKATFTPSANLANNKTYTVTITTGMKDSAGNALALANIWNFTTSAISDTTPPTVTDITPAEGTTDVPVTSVITATFSEDMNDTTINGASFILKEGANSVSGTVVYDISAKKATFTPAANLLYNKVYTATLTKDIKDANGTPLPANKEWTFSTITDPKVASFTPLNGAAKVTVSTTITATFTEPMNDVTISGTTFLLKEGVTSVSGIVVYNAQSKTATFTPSASLLYGKVYTATLTNEIRDATGTSLSANTEWIFTTITDPKVASFTPVNGATKVAVSTTITATFTEPMKESTIIGTSFLLKEGANSVSGNVVYDAQTKTATFTPLASLLYGKVYTVTMTTDMQDATGTPLSANREWSFTTIYDPKVVATFPANGSTDIELNSNISVTFDKDMDASTINGTSFTLKQGSTSISGTVDYNALTKTATFNPSGSLNYNTLYSAVVSKGVKDNEGVNLLIDFNFSFETRIFEDNFDRSNGAPGNNWNTYSDGSTYQNAIDFNYMAQSASGAGTAQLARYLESYTSTKFPLRIKSRLYVDGTSTYGWSYINYGAINNLDWPGEGNFIQIRIEWSGYQYKAVISNTSSYIQSVNIGFTTKQWYLLKIEFFPSFVRLKLWPESEMEPTLWTVQLDRAVWDLGGEYLILGQRNGNPNYYHSLWDDLVIQDLN